MNRLEKETSPYLLQHAGNPVDWHPWGEAALEQAREEKMPILLSVGYSACHWCHVMAHESFEDPATAELMNRLFVNIKVDREERPDLDKIYQTAHQLMLQRPGGWPLTMFLDPQDHRPFFGGTYFPLEPRQGMPGFGDVLRRVAEYFEINGAEIRDGGNALVEALQQLEPGEPADADTLNDTPLAGARKTIGEQIDRENGGLGDAPKFPHPTSIERLLRHWRSTAHDSEPDVEALYLCALTLTRMAKGGIYDQLGGGFCRYSVDAHWMIPHFEKMLYDNGPLLALYAQLWQVSGDELYRRVANETADWVIRDMHIPRHGFYATLDADSEGEEGKFYVWTPDQARAVLPDDEFSVIAPRFGLDQEPNFEGHWHLRVCQSIDEVAASTARNPAEVRRLIDQGRSRLLAVRDARIWPGRDEKILTSWNGLMIRGLAIASRALQREDLALSAAHAVDFIRERLVVEGQLRVSYKDDQARFDAYLDDYAYLLDGVIELLQARWNADHLKFAIWLADALLENFCDTDNGGFFFTSHHHEMLIHRSKPLSDDATPAGNGIAAQALGRLGHLLGNTRYLEAAENTLRCGWADMARFPHGHTALVTALEEYLTPPTVVILRGAAADIAGWAGSINSMYAPNRLLLAIADDASDLPPALADKEARDVTVAYVCRGTTCSAPLQSLEALAAELSESDA
jgi:uncharacterized protein YyaL (SSP411 family)